MMGYPLHKGLLKRSTFLTQFQKQRDVSGKQSVAHIVNGPKYLQLKVEIVNPFPHHIAAIDIKQTICCMNLQFSRLWTLF